MKINFIAYRQNNEKEVKATLQPFKQALFQYFNNFYDRTSSKLQKKQKQNRHQQKSTDFFENLILFLNRKQMKQETINQLNEPLSFQDEVDEDDYEEESLRKNQDTTKIETSYGFLRNIWGSHYFNRVANLKDNEDRLDKINKIVAMMKQRINYMSKKQSYLYQKDELQTYKRCQLKLNAQLPNDRQKIELGIHSQYIFNNPIFQKLKEDSQKVRMQNEEHIRSVQQLKNQLVQLQQKNQTLETSLKQIKKKNQQLQLKLIENGKKNINLERQIIDLKSDTFKLKQKARQLDQIKSACSDSAGKNFIYDNYTSSEVHQLNEQVQQPKSLLRVSSGILQDQAFQSIILKDKLQNFNQKDDRLAFKSVFKTSYRYSSKIQQNEPIIKVQKVQRQNEQENTGPGNVLKNNTYKYQNQAKLTLSSSKMDFKQQVPLSFRYIKQTGSARKSLLSSVKSVDNFDKQSISKLRFQRTKGVAIGSNLQRNGRKCSQDFSKSSMISNIKKKCWVVTGNENQPKIL